MTVRLIVYWLLHTACTEWTLICIFELNNVIHSVVLKIKMENYKKPSVKNPSTEFSDEFVDIVNEINDFISVLEVRQKELAAGTPKSEPQGSPREGSIERLSALEFYKTDSGADFFSDSRTESSIGGDSRTNSKSDYKSDSPSNSRASSLSDLGKLMWSNYSCSKYI